MNTLCGHCGRETTATVTEIPGRVCTPHAIEYWTAMLAEVKKGFGRPLLGGDLQTGSKHHRADLAHDAVRIRTGEGAVVDVSGFQLPRP